MNLPQPGTATATIAPAGAGGNGLSRPRPPPRHPMSSDDDEEDGDDDEDDDEDDERPPPLPPHGKRSQVAAPIRNRSESPPPPLPPSRGGRKRAAAAAAAAAAGRNQSYHSLQRHSSSGGNLDYDNVSGVGGGQPQVRARSRTLGDGMGMFCRPVFDNVLTFFVTPKNCPLSVLWADTKAQTFLCPCSRCSPSPTRNVRALVRAEKNRPWKLQRQKKNFKHVLPFPSCFFCNEGNAATSLLVHLSSLQPLSNIRMFLFPQNCSSQDDFGVRRAIGPLLLVSALSDVQYGLSRERT